MLCITNIDQEDKMNYCLERFSNVNAKLVLCDYLAGKIFQFCLVACSVVVHYVDIS